MELMDKKSDIFHEKETIFKKFTRGIVTKSLGSQYERHTSSQMDPA